MLARPNSIGGSMRAEPEIREAADEAYEAPDVTVLGTVESLTAGVTVTGSPSDCSSNIC
jgi:hypothetical protein